LDDFVLKKKIMPEPKNKSIQLTTRIASWLLCYNSFFLPLHYKGFIYDTIKIDRW
jgi:hypothetical protein